MQLHSKAQSAPKPGVQFGSILQKVLSLPACFISKLLSRKNDSFLHWDLKTNKIKRFILIDKKLNYGKQ
jgi:hypothetical protein